MRRTKIVCTIGPSTEQPDMIAELVECGMDVARLNLSHGCQEDHLRRVSIIKEVCRQLHKNVAILIDNRGPEVRIGEVSREPAVLSAGRQFILTARPVTGDQHQVSITYPDLTREIKPGKLVLIDDGMISLEVTEVSGDDIICRVVNGGELFSRKGMNFPGTSISLPAVNQLDRDDLKLLLGIEIDFVAASFARSWKDIVEVRRLIEEYRGEAKIIAKIESQEGMTNFASILEAADGVMIARGDLGVEAPAEEVPLIQKQFIHRCNRAGKPVITATQMLDSMIRNPRPTRAEASDVANAIFDGTDAVMLSGETAVGRYPVESVKTLSRIARRIEQALEYKQILQHFETTMEKTITDAISYSTCHTAQELNAAAIITSTQSGYTARMVSKYRPQAPVVAVTPKRKVAASLK
ncbi:MAG TPA: pyruvate kinase, partial [Firmicutes bacterium]|nr:pyruvate kinase [Bacillota bacterium]